MAQVPSKEEFVKTFDDLQKVIDVDDSRGRSVPSNMNFIEEGFLTKDTGTSLFGAVETELCHSDFNYKKKDGSEYRIRAKGKYLQKYDTGTETWINIDSGTVVFTLGTPCYVTQVGHNLKAGSKVSFETTGSLPTGVNAGQTYYVIASGLTADVFYFSETEGGAAVDGTTSTTGTDTMYRNYTADAEFGWYVYDDILYGCNANENYFTWNGTDFVEYDSAPKGNVLEVYDDRMFVTGVTAEPLTIYYSATGDATDWTDTSKVLQPLGTDVVKTVKNYYGVLMIFKRHSIWKLSFVFDQLTSLYIPKLEQQSGNYGACSRKAVSWVENDLWFFTGTEVRALGFTDQQTGVFGINKTVISEPIKETLKNIDQDDLDLVATFYHNRRFYLSVTLGANSYNDTVFVSHLLYGNLWTKYENRIKASAFDFIEVDDVVYSSKSSGDYGIIKWDETLTADNGAAITSEVFFKKIENEDFNTFNTYRYCDLIFKDLSATVTITVRSDASDNRNSDDKQFYVGSVIEGEENSLGEVTIGQYLIADSFGESVSSTPFLRRRVSFLKKAQSVTIGLYNSSATEKFTIASYGVSGFKQPRRFFSGNKITSM